MTLSRLFLKIVIEILENYEKFLKNFTKFCVTRSFSFLQEKAALFDIFSLVNLY